MCSLGCSSNVSKAVTTTEKIMKTHEVFSSTTPFDVDLDIFLHVKCFFEVIFKTYTCICLFSTLTPMGNILSFSKRCVLSLSLLDLAWKHSLLWQFSARLQVQVSVKPPPSTLTFTGAKTIDLRLRLPLLSVKPSHMPVLGWTTIETGNASDKGWEK